jgi:predicted DNA-binding transcriptional regulator YafY
LADRLGVSPRTVRNDIGALRDIGYTIEGTRGNEGGYRLSPDGTTIPPLLLDAAEATALAVGLHSGLSCIIGGMEETSARALAKLESILPAAVRSRVHNLAHFTVPVAGNQPMPIVDPNLIVTLIDHCHRHERLRFIYRGADRAGASGTGSPEYDTGDDAGSDDRDDDGVHLEVEPYRLVNRQHRWHLLTFDPEADGWRVFRAERIVPKTPSGPLFEPRPLPAENIGDYVERHIVEPRWRHSAEIIVDAPASSVKETLVSAEGIVEPFGDERSRVIVGGESVATMALALARLDATFTVVDSAELREYLDRLSRRLGQAANESGTSDRSVPISTNSG